MTSHAKKVFKWQHARPTMFSNVVIILWKVFNTVKKFPMDFRSAALSGRSKSDLFFDQKAHLFVLFYPLFVCWHVGDLLFDLLSYGLAVVHFYFQVWDSNPDVHSKSAQNSLGNLFQFFTVNWHQYFVKTVYKWHHTKEKYLNVVTP